jgi:hypothetical protein
MTEQIKQALEGFAQNPVLSGKALRDLLQQDREAFYRQSLIALQNSLQALQSEGETSGYEHLIALLVQNGLLINDIQNPAVFEKELSIAVARKISQIDPQLDIRLARLLPSRDGSRGLETRGETAERLLDLLDATSSGARLVPLITPLMQSPDPRLRARVALMIGRRLQNPRSAEALLKEPDSRVRANAIESLWGSDTPAIRALLRQALSDSNQRVVGNALYGLYRLRDQSMIPDILKMAADERPAHRVTAAWAMGETADPRFAPALEKLSTNLYLAVRKTAAGALARVRRTEEAATTAPQLDVSVLRAEKLPNGQRMIWMRVEAPDGRFAAGLPPTALILEEDGNTVVDYQVSERHVSERLGVGFALCAGAGISAESLGAAEEAASSCLLYRRATDCWAVLKLFSDERSVEFTWHDAKVKLASDEPIEPPRYSVNSETLKQAISTAALRSGSRPAALDAVRLLLPGISTVRGARHLIVLAGPELAEASSLSLVATAAIANQVAIHAVVPGVPQSGVEELCRSTGGAVIAAPSAEDIADAYKRVCLGLIERYEIHYRPQPKARAVERADPGSVRLRIFSTDGYAERLMRLR